MRTTLTLDDDVVAVLRKLERDRDVTWKQVVNDVLRAGVRTLDQRVDHQVGLRTEPVSLGGALVDVTNVHDALAVVEGDDRA